MSLQTWADNGWLRPHRTSRQEILALFFLGEMFGGHLVLSSSWMASLIIVIMVFSSTNNLLT